MWRDGLPLETLPVRRRRPHFEQTVGRRHAYRHDRSAARHRSNGRSAVNLLDALPQAAKPGAKLCRIEADTVVGDGELHTLRIGGQH